MINWQEWISDLGNEDVSRQLYEDHVIFGICGYYFEKDGSVVRIPPEELISLKKESKEE